LIDPSVSKSGGKGAPIDKGYTKIYSNENAFTAVKSDGSIRVWGNSYSGGEKAPVSSDYTNIYSTSEVGVGAKVCLIRNTNLVVA
jgi:hypothetical protein